MCPGLESFNPGFQYLVSDVCQITARLQTSLAACFGNKLIYAGQGIFCR
jgi:hypothetical protein